MDVHRLLKMRINKTLIVSAGGPVNILTGLDASQMVKRGPLPETRARALSIQMGLGGSGHGLVLDGIYGTQSDGLSPRIPSSSEPTDVTVEISGATAAVAVPYMDDDVDVRFTWVDGSHVGDPIRVSYDVIEMKSIQMSEGWRQVRA